MRYFETRKDEQGRRIRKTADGTEQQLAADIFTTAFCERCPEKHLLATGTVCLRPLAPRD